jgi:RNA polymerase sigma-70 factor (ECF subfamily)
MTEEETISLNIDALKQGNRSELARMVEQFSDSIYRVALRMLNNPADAEDVLQETFIKAIRALPTFEGRSSLSTWLYRIAVNESLMLIRKQKPEAALTEEEFEDPDDSTSYPSFQILDWCCLPEEDFLSAETRKVLNLAIQKLPKNLRTVFVLRDIEGLSIRDTAEALDITESNVKTRLLRARMKLREELTIYFGEYSKENSRNEQSTAL